MCFWGIPGSVAVRTGCEGQGELQRCCGGTVQGCRGRMEPTGRMRGGGTSGGVFRSPLPRAGTAVESGRVTQDAEAPVV